MFRFYPLVIALQVYCFYDAYTNNVDQKWYWLLFFFPLFGSLIYLYHFKIKGRNFAGATQGAISLNKRSASLKKLEEDFKYADTFVNVTALADKYVEIKKYDDAIVLYESNLDRFDKDDIETNSKLVHVNYLIGNHEKAVEYGNRINGQKIFDDSEGKIAYAWSLYHIEQIENSEKRFQEMDGPFSNYASRIEYCKFLSKQNRKDEAFMKIKEMEAEINRLEGREKREKSWVKGALNKIKKEIELA